VAQTGRKHPLPGCGDHATLDLFEEVGAEADLLALLRQALGTREGIEIVWSRA